MKISTGFLRFKCINDDQIIAQEIVLLPMGAGSNINVDTSQGNPVMGYNLGYKNIGSRCLSVNMEVYVAHVKRDDPDDVRSFRKFNVRHDRFSIKPGETYWVEGTLNWRNMDGDTSGQFGLSSNMMPRLVYPGTWTDDAIYMVTDGSDARSRPGRTVPYNALGKRQANQQDFNLFFQSMANAHYLNFEGIAVGIGQVSRVRPCETIYKSSFQFEEGSLTTVNIDRSDTTFYFVTNYLLRAPGDVDRKYVQIKRFLTGKFPAYRIVEREINGNALLSIEGDKHIFLVAASKLTKERFFQLELQMMYR